MRRTHRKTHRIMWLVLGPLVTLGIFLGVMNRNQIPAQDSPLEIDAPSTEPPSQEVK